MSAHEAQLLKIRPVREDYTSGMHRAASAVALFIMVLMMTPVLACAATPTMSPMERDCCEHQHGTCANMSNQGCCQVQVRNLDQLPSHVTVAPALKVHLAAALHSLPIGRSLSAVYRSRIPDGHPPPGLWIANTTVLRI